MGPASNPRVAVVSSRGRLTEAVREAMELADWRSVVPPSAPVFLKINLGWDLFVPGSVTSPGVLDAVIRVLKERTDRITIVESDQVLEDVDRAARRFGIAEICGRHGIDWKHLGRMPARRLFFPENRIFREVEIPECCLDGVLLTLPVMKTHDKTVISGAIKNQWGCINKMRHSLHLVLDEALAELLAILPPALAVVDATVAFEGNGPKTGIPVVVDRVLASRDPVACDAIQAVLMGFDPMAIPHLRLCHDRGIGVADPATITVLGEQPLQPRTFRPAKQNVVSWTEMTLRRSFLRPFVFDTPVFAVALRVAKAWYRAWDLVNRDARWKVLDSRPEYACWWKRP